MKIEPLFYCYKSKLYTARISYKIGKCKFSCLVVGDTEKETKLNCYREVSGKMISMGIQPFRNMGFFTEVKKIKEGLFL